MKSDLYNKFVMVLDRVKNDLRRRGVVIPVANDDGSVTLGSYSIDRDLDGFYFINDRNNNVIIDHINLPQTAVVLANGLALGRCLDAKMVEADQNYGYALFDELVQSRAIEKNNRRDPDYADIMLTKCVTSRLKKESCRRDIIRSFEKLRKLA